MNDRRKLLLGATCSFILFSPKIARPQKAVSLDASGRPRHNIFTYRAQNWRDHFENCKHGAIIADTKSRCLHFWNNDETVYKVYPTSVPLTPELTRTGYTSVTKKIVGPEWRPTKSMRKRDPKLPVFMPAGPDNPLGSHALYLNWPSYRIHGTSDTRKIGRQSSSGCIGLYNEDIEELFELSKIGTQVKLI